MQAWEKEKAQFERKIETSHEKLQLVKERKDGEIKDLGRKLNDITGKLKAQMQKSNELERKFSMERDTFN